MSNKQNRVLSIQSLELIDSICSSIFNEWRLEAKRVADESDELEFKDVFYDPEQACDFYAESLWEYENKIPLNLALEIMSYYSEKLEWDFFFTLVYSLPDRVKMQEQVKYGNHLFKQQALMLIDGYHLRDYFTNRLDAEKQLERKNKLIDESKYWKGTLDPGKINWIGQIPPEYRKDNRNDLYTRHPCG